MKIFYKQTAAFTHARNKVTQTLRKAKADFFVSIIENTRGNGKKTWQILNKLLGKHNKKEIKAIELAMDNALIRDPTIVANTFNNYFIDSISEITRSIVPSNILPRLLNEDQPIFQIQNITEAEVIKIIAALKNSKAMDVHGIDNNFLKTHNDALIQPITLMVNQSINQRAVPATWKEAIITPIFKSGSKIQVANYWPISILPIISKVAEKWIAKQLIEHLDKGFTPLHRMQFGFRPNHSTESANCFLIEQIKYLLDKSPCVGAVFLDLKKAFDTVNHQVLLTKLTHFNFSTDAISWFKSFLTEHNVLI